jgi:predicted transcriptional regulator
MTLPLAAITAHLTADQMRLAAWYWFDGVDQHEIAGWLGITRRAVGQRLDTIRTQLEHRGIPLPKRLEHPTVTRNVRPIGTSLAGFA